MTIRSELSDAELAKGWHLGWVTIQRLKRRAEGRPPMEIVGDQDCRPDSW